MPDTAPSDQPMPAAGPAVVPAATVIVFRHAASGGAPELLMLRRADAMRFAAGAAVFPGGRVDPADYDLARRLVPDAPLEMAAARIAAIRETLEETGLLIATARPVSAAEAAAARGLLRETGRLDAVLDRYGWELRPGELEFFAHWCPLSEGAFDTRFFLSDLGTGAVDVLVDSTENTHLFWATAAAALVMADRGDIMVIFPTRRNLERLACYGTYADAVADITAHPVTRIHPKLIDRQGSPWLTIPDGHGYPVIAQTMQSARRG